MWCLKPSPTSTRPWSGMSLSESFDGLTGSSRVAFPGRAVPAGRPRPALRAARPAQPSLRRESEGRYAWIEEAQDRDRLLGSVRLEGKRLVLETTSRQRAERGRQLPASLAGDAIIFRATRSEDVDQAVRHMPPGAAPREAEGPPELAAQA